MINSSRQVESSDAIVIGSGAAGGIVAAVLAESGKSVLLLERGRVLGFEDVPRDHLRNHRISIYGNNTGPSLIGNPRVFVDGQGRAATVNAIDGRYSNNAVAVGGGTLVYGGMAFRFPPDDFRMASKYGVPADSSLADWPISYDELERHYGQAEWEIGVAGDSSPDSFQTPRTRGFPMPSVARGKTGELLRGAANSLGWSTFTPPLLINTVPFGGRGACIACSECVGFACPTNAKNGSQNTAIPRAIATGRCKLVTGAMTEKIQADVRGRATGVSYFVATGEGFERRVATAKTIVVSAGAIESARLLLNSACDASPHGLGNNFDQVGRHVQGHYYPTAYGLMRDDVYDGRGPGVTIATCDFVHDNPGVIGGALLADDFTVIPIIFWKNLLPPDLPRWGAANKRFMRENYRRFVQIKGPVHEIPNPDSRVTVDRDVKDRWGIPVARLSGSAHPETVRTSLYIRDRAEQWLRAADATRVWSAPVGLGFSAGPHQAGTCRMGTDPKTSVTDTFGRVHGHENLFVVDAGLHVTNGAFNPVLTIMALAFRCAEHIASST